MDVSRHIMSKLLLLGPKMSNAAQKQIATFFVNSDAENDRNLLTVGQNNKFEQSNLQIIKRWTVLSDNQINLIF